jgi:hypothetical protein
MRTTFRHQLLVLLLLCAPAACAPAASESRFAPQASDDVGLVQVTNDGHDDFVLYMHRDGVRYRLGRVARMETALFHIPAADLGPRPSYQVQLVAEPAGMGGRAFSTGPISWRPGQDLAGRVARSVSTQQFVVYTR